MARSSAEIFFRAPALRPRSWARSKAIVTPSGSCSSSCVVRACARRVPRSAPTAPRTWIGLGPRGGDPRRRDRGPGRRSPRPAAPEATESEDPAAGAAPEARVHHRHPSHPGRVDVRDLTGVHPASIRAFACMSSGSTGPPASVPAATRTPPPILDENSLDVALASNTSAATSPGPVHPTASSRPRHRHHFAAARRTSQTHRADQNKRIRTRPLERDTLRSTTTSERCHEQAPGVCRRRVLGHRITHQRPPRPRSAYRLVVKFQLGRRARRYSPLPGVAA